MIDRTIQGDMSKVTWAAFHAYTLKQELEEKRKTKTDLPALHVKQRWSLSVTPIRGSLIAWKFG